MIAGLLPHHASLQEPPTPELLPSLDGEASSHNSSSMRGHLLGKLLTSSSYAFTILEASLKLQRATAIYNFICSYNSLKQCTRYNITLLGSPPVHSLTSHKNERVVGKLKLEHVTTELRIT